LAENEDLSLSLPLSLLQAGEGKAAGPRQGTAARSRRAARRGRAQRARGQARPSRGQGRPSRGQGRGSDGGGDRLGRPEIENFKVGEVFPFNFGSSLQFLDTGC